MHTSTARDVLGADVSGPTAQQHLLQCFHASWHQTSAAKAAFAQGNCAIKHNAFSPECPHTTVKKTNRVFLHHCTTKYHHRYTHSSPHTDTHCHCQPDRSMRGRAQRGLLRASRPRARPAELLPTLPSRKKPTAPLPAQPRSRECTQLHAAPLPPVLTETKRGEIDVF